MKIILGKTVLASSLVLVLASSVSAEGAEKVLSTTATVAQSTDSSTGDVFKDVNKSHWAYEFIQTAKQKGMINGYDDGKFYPENTVKTSEFVKMFVASYKGNMNDSSGTWYHPYFDLGKSYNWDIPNLDHPDEELNRLDVAKILINATGVKNKEPAYYITKMYENGITNGKNDSSVSGYSPDDKMTRAEAVKFILTFNDKFDSIQKAVATEDPRDGYSNFGNYLKYYCKVFGLTVNDSGTFKDGTVYSWRILKDDKVVFYVHIDYGVVREINGVPVSTVTVHLNPPPSLNDIDYSLPYMYNFYSSLFLRTKYRISYEQFVNYWTSGDKNVDSLSFIVRSNDTISEFITSKINRAMNEFNIYSIN